MRTDRYETVVGLILAAVSEHPYDPNGENHPLRTRLHDIVRTEGRQAALRSHCDRMGHEPETLMPVRVANANGELMMFRVACTFCGVELKEVDE